MTEVQQAVVLIAGGIALSVIASTMFTLWLHGAFSKDEPHLPRPPASSSAAQLAHKASRIGYQQGLEAAAHRLAREAQRHEEQNRYDFAVVLRTVLLRIEQEARDARETC